MPKPLITPKEYYFAAMECIKKEGVALLAHKRAVKEKMKFPALVAKTEGGRGTYRELFEKQNGCCAICGCPETAKAYGITRRLGIDHCHKTGRLRGLLCTRCNSGLGFFRDSYKIMEGAIKYIKKYQK